MRPQNWNLKSLFHTSKQELMKLKKIWNKKWDQNHLMSWQKKNFSVES